MSRDFFEKLPVLGILRGIREADIAPLLDLAQEAKLEAIEITMNTALAEKLIKKTVKAAKGRIKVGAGTVIDEKSLNRALDSGAEFVVMPIFDLKIVQYCVRREIPVFPGALTPTEICHAWDAGATMVKVFPAGCFGPKYFSQLRGPFSQVKLMAVGGVSTDNVQDYFKAGANAVAIGESIFSLSALKEENYKPIRESLAKFLSAAKAAVS